MSIEKSKVPLFVAAVVSILAAFLFLPFIQNFIIYFAENILLGRELRRPEKWIAFIQLSSLYIIFVCVFCAAIYWFELSLKNISLVLFLTTVAVTVFFIVYKASWVFSDDHEFLTSTALRIPHPFYSMGRRFYGHMEYNFLIYTPFYSYPLAYYIVNTIYYLVTVIFISKITIFVDSKINPHKNQIFYVVYFLTWFYFNTKTAGLFYEVVFPEKMVIMFFAIISHLILKGIETGKYKFYIFAFVFSVLATYFKEPVFAALFAIAFSMLIIYKKELSKERLLFIFGIFLNTIVYLTLYYFLSYKNSSGSYAEGRKVELLELLIKMAIETPYVVIIFALAVYRVSIYFLTLKGGARVLDVKDALLFGGIAYIVVYLALGMISGYYLLPSMVLAIPAFFTLVIKFFKHCKNIVAVSILIFLVLVLPINIENFIGSNRATVKSREIFVPKMEELYSVLKDCEEIYWYIDPEKWEPAEHWYLVVTKISLNYLKGYEPDIKTIQDLPAQITDGQIILATSEIEHYKNSEYYRNGEGIRFYYYWR